MNGELCISTAALMSGYYNNESETDKVIFEENNVKWLKTGDLAMVSEEGIVTITGRLKRIYSKISSSNLQVRVYPMRTEETLGKSELVENCCVVGVRDKETSYKSIAHIILKDKCTDQKSAEAELDKLCRENLPESHVPDKYVFMDKFPLTRAGKVDFRALEALTENGE